MSFVRYVLVTGAGLVWLAAGVVLAAQTPAATKDSQPAPEKPAAQDAPVVREVGGRLVVSDATVVVTGSRDDPPRDSSVATKIDTPLIETPRSVSIIDRRTIDDMGLISTTQAHDYAVGFSLVDERGPAYARGFPVDFYDLRRDGLRTYSWSVREPAAIDRIQYLRGPAAVLYGDGSPGGLVNMVLKKPLPIRRHELSASGGSQGFGRLTADFTGPLTSSRRVRYRLVAASEWLGNGFDNEERRLTLLPTIAVDVGTQGTITFDTEFYDQRGRSYRHVVPATPASQRGDFSEYPWDLNVNSPEDGWTGGNISPGLRLDLGLGQQTSLHVAARYTKIDGEIEAQALSGLAPGGRAATRFQYHEISTWHEYQSDSFVATALHTGRLEHRFVGGVEAGLSTADSEIGIGAATSLDIFNPVYDPQPEPVRRPTRYDVSRLGFYAVDQIRFGVHVIVNPALRWSRLGIENRAAGVGEPQSTEHALSPSLGVVVLPRRWLSFYGTVARGFEPPTPGQYLEDGRGLAPAENASVEGGVKADLFAQKISLTSAVYRIRRTNVPEADVRGFYRQIGEAGSHGVEVEAVGSLAPRLGMRAGYAWTGTEIISDTSGFVGRELPNAPRHKAELWMRYRFSGSIWQRLTTAGGVVYTSDRFTARDNLVVTPAYTRFDASASYQLAGSRLAVGFVAQNLTNRRYVTSGSNTVFIAAPQRRLAVQLTSAF